MSEIDFKITLLLGIDRGHYIMIKCSIKWKYIAISIPNKITSKYMRGFERKKEIGKSIIIMDYFKIILKN